MSKPEPHTVFRFKLRALLVVTAGVALLLTLAMPWVRRLDNFQWWHFVAVLAVIAMAAGSSLVYWILTRRHIGMRCGKLLATLPERQQPYAMQIEVCLLLFGLVYTIVYLVFVGDPTNRDDLGIVLVPIVTVPFVFWWSSRLAKHCLALLTEEGNRRKVEFCENGLIMGNRLHEWHSPTLRDIQWSGSEIVLDIHRYFLTVPFAPQSVPVPPQQRESIEAILERYFELRKDLTA